MKKITALITLTVAMTVFFLTGACEAQTGVTADAMKPMLEKTKSRINEWFRILDRELESAAERLSTADLSGRDARRILKELMIGRSSIVDCGIVDESGILITVQPPEYRSYEGRDISSEQHIMAVRETKRPVMSDSFNAVEGVYSVALEYPIFSDKGRYRGSVSLIIKYAAFLNNILEKIVKDMPCKVWVMQPDGLILYDSDPNQINRNVFTDDMFKPFHSLITFSKNVVSEKNGTGSYDFYSKGFEDKAVVKKNAIWDTVGLYGNEWRIIVMEIEK
ncbi:MAG: cache domain-containing protein [Candidatus Omnitrophota bacterium]